MGLSRLHGILDKIGYLLWSRFFKYPETWFKRHKDLSRSTYSISSAHWPARLNTRVSVPLPRISQRDALVLEPAVDRIMEHRFDLLGSGPTQVFHGMQCRGLEGSVYDPVISKDHRSWNHVNASNRDISEKIAAKINGPYVPIDWHIDFKSGHRWDEQTYYLDITHSEPAADIKVPWELARMQGLPWLAWSYGLRLGPDGNGDECLREFRNQILDFISSNPPRFGVNWNCSMEVGIRVANWLAAYDIFKSYGAQFDDEFEYFLCSSVYDHAYHIRTNLESTPFFKGNHYLANIVGLLIACSYLPSDLRVDSWWAFCVRELYEQAELQFLSDGANFEAATAYHDLSLEMLIFGAAYILSFLEREDLPENSMGPTTLAPTNGDYRGPIKLAKLSKDIDSGPLNRTLMESIRSACQFSLATTLSSGEKILIGDNDSGRFFKLFPYQDQIPYTKSVFPGAPYPVRAAMGLTSDLDSQRGAVESIFISSLKKRSIELPVMNDRKSGVEYSRDGQIRLRAFKDFGLYIYGSDYYEASVRCGRVGQNGRGGHAHNDQLSITLALHGQPALIDPGVYVYTPLPEHRNRFRSTETHNTLCPPGLEQNPWPPGRAGLFRMKDRSRARVTVVEPLGFTGKHVGFPEVHMRSMQFEPKRIMVEDFCPMEGVKAVNLMFDPAALIEPDQTLNGITASFNIGRLLIHCSDATWTIKEAACAPGYGVLEKTFQATLLFRADRITWSISILDPA
jgi:hypothetical protein